MTNILILDNYDSFVYNIAQYLGEAGAAVKVERNDSPRLDELMRDVDGFVVSPGPGHPKDTNRSLEVISENGYDRPLLGVCLGHQAIAFVHGGKITRADRVVHGKVCQINHSSDPFFDDVPGSFAATRYHSLIVSKEGFPRSLQVLAESDDGEIMALRVRGRDVYGVQFHPESVMTAHGRTFISNFLRMCRS
ncbi:MAG: aminodeoxychorismate/anthranilate synthase component II [Methanobacteriota archaeon]|nr:MAG: aminodeoxychorismate/anthranilate synthase component II [Euryarchaeota archaeon]